MAEIFGNIYSIERCSASLFGETSFLIKLQGCNMRCMHCNSPETFSSVVNIKTSVEEIVSKILQVENFVKKGGVVISGGEPLLQIDFVTEVFRRAKELNLKTTLDTSGILTNTADVTKVNKMLQYTDLVLLNIKHIDLELHKKLTGQPNSSMKQFAQYLSQKDIPTRIGYVVIPNVNTNKKYLVALGEFLATLKNIKGLDVVPFCNFAQKYKTLNMEYKLKDIQTPTNEYVQEVKNTIIDSIKNCKNSPV